MDGQVPSKFVHPFAFGAGECLAHGAVQALAQGVVPPLESPGQPVGAHATGRRSALNDLPRHRPRIWRVRRQRAIHTQRALTWESTKLQGSLGGGGYIPRFRRQECRAQRREGLGFFSSHLAVCRAAPKTRSAARKLRRSTSTARKTHRLALWVSCRSSSFKQPLRPANFAKKLLVAHRVVARFDNGRAATGCTTRNGCFRDAPSPSEVALSLG